jgi:hypothetical protein
LGKISGENALTRYHQEWRIDDEKCSLCKKVARFSIRRIKTSEWLYVCATHDNFVGVENLMALGYNNSDARTLNREVKIQIPELFRNDE